MRQLSGRSLKRLTDREKLWVLEAYQRALAARGLIPPAHTLLLRRFEVHLKYAGGILLGTVVAASTLLFCFWLFHHILHT